MKALRFIAASEVASGAMLLLVVLITSNDSKLPVWYQSASLFLAFYAIVAGIALWKRNLLGHWLSLVLQTVQIVQLATNTFLMKIEMGFLVSYFEFAGGGLEFTPGFGANLGLFGAGHAERPGMGVNLLAFAFAFLLVMAIKETQRTTATVAPVLTSHDSGNVG